MQKKRIKLFWCITGIVLVGLFIVWICTTIAFSKKYPDVQKKYYEMNQKVYFENDTFVDGDSMNGYNVMAKDAEIISFDEYIERFEINEEMQEFFKNDMMQIPDMLYVVTVEVENVNNTETGIDLFEWIIQSDSAVAQINEILFICANPKCSQLSFALRENSSMELYLIFGLNKALFKESNWNKLMDNNYDMWMTVTLLPTKKMIRLQ